MKIVAVKPKHSPQIAHLNAQLGYPQTPKEAQRRIRVLLKSKQHHLVLAKHHKQVVGWVHLEIIESILHEARLEIRALVVDEDHRSQGVGKKLIQYTKQYAQKKRIRSIFLRTNIRRKNAHRFYKREGFKLTKTSYKFEIVLKS